MWVLLAVACRRPHRAGPWRRPANFIHIFLSRRPTESVQIFAGPRNLLTALRPCTLQLLPARVRCSHACPKTEEHLLEMEGETAIDGELCGLQFG